MSEYIIEIPEEPAKVVRDGWNLRVEWQYKQREKIVRCRDCKHRAGANVQAVDSDLCMWLNIIVKPDGFCAWGENEGNIQQ